jgi:Family of unknown function (DUF5946)
VQAVAVHLMCLCIVLERGAEPRIVRTPDRKRVRAGRLIFTGWIPPKPIGTQTLLGPLRARGPEEHAASVEAWARDVWAAWELHHETVRGWLDIASRGPREPDG